MLNKKTYLNSKISLLISLGVLLFSLFPKAVYSQNQFKYNFGIYSGLTKGGLSQTVNIDNFQCYRLLANYPLGLKYGISLEKLLAHEYAIEVSYFRTKFTNWDAKELSELYLNTNTSINEFSLSLNKILPIRSAIEISTGLGLNMSYLEFSFPSYYLDTSLDIEDETGEPILRNSMSFGLNLKTKLLYNLSSNLDIFVIIRAQQSFFEDIYIIENNYNMIDLMLGINLKIVRTKNIYKIG